MIMQIDAFIKDDGSTDIEAVVKVYEESEFATLTITFDKCQQFRFYGTPDTLSDLVVKLNQALNEVVE